MSKEVAKQIVQRTKEDNVFLESLLSDPDKTLAGYDLTEKEREFFRNTDKKSLEGLKDSCFELAP